MFVLTKRSKASVRGATAIEYGLIAALIMVAALLAVTAVGGGLNKTFDNLKTAILGTVSQPFTAFNGFTSSYWDGELKTYLIESSNSNGTVIGTPAYNSQPSQATLQNYLKTNLGGMFFTNITSGQGVQIPALDGPNTQIDLPYMQAPFVALEPQGSNTGYSFYAANGYAYTSISSIPKAVSALTTACTNEGGSLTYLPNSGSSGAYECTGGRYYPTSAGSTLLNGQ